MLIFVQRYYVYVTILRFCCSNREITIHKMLCLKSQVFQMENDLLIKCIWCEWILMLKENHGHTGRSWTCVFAVTESTWDVCVCMHSQYIYIYINNKQSRLIQFFINFLWHNFFYLHFWPPLLFWLASSLPYTYRCLFIPYYCSQKGSQTPIATRCLLHNSSLRMVFKQDAKLKFKMCFSFNSTVCCCS